MPALLVEDAQHDYALRGLNLGMSYFTDQRLGEKPRTGLALILGLLALSGREANRSSRSPFLPLTCKINSHWHADYGSAHIPSSTEKSTDSWGLTPL